MSVHLFFLIISVVMLSIAIIGNWLLGPDDDEYLDDD